MKIDVLLGLQWGDEGKGKAVDALTPNYDIIARFQGGPNAGHTLEIDGQKHVLHTIPSGIFHKKTLNVIGNGVIIDPYILWNEILRLKEKKVDARENLLISKKAHLILPTHRLLDAAYEESKGKLKIGSTLKGIGPAYTDKYSRNGIRIGDISAKNFSEMYEALKKRHLQIIDTYKFNYADYKIDGLLFKEYEEKWFDAITKLKDFNFIDSEYFINESLQKNMKILAEGAQGSMLDVDFGSYPYVTSSNTICAGVCSGLGVAPNKIGNVYGLFKAYCTRVGSGPFPTELNDECGKKLQDFGHEFGSTTGRPRRCGWLDMPALKYAIMLNGVTHLIITKVDVLNTFEKIKVATHYAYNKKQSDHIISELTEAEPIYSEFKGWMSDLNGHTSVNSLPKELQQYIQFIEKQVNVPMYMVSTGPDRVQTLFNKID